MVQSRLAGLCRGDHGACAGALWHRHHKPVVGHRFSIGVENGEIRGACIVGRPVARIEPISTKPRWVNTEKFLANLPLADRELLDELREFDELIDNHEFD